MRNRLFGKMYFANASDPDWSGKIPIPVFSDAELAIEPAKWLKRLLMARLGLISHEELENQIQRYSMDDLDFAEQQCRMIVEDATRSAKNFMIVLKAVGRDDVARIQNFRVYSADEVSATFSEISRVYGHTDRQLWFCLSIVDPGTISLGGRLTLPKTGYLEVIELIWFTSPRRIDEVSGENFPFPFWRAQRKQGQLAFRTETLHIPSKYLQKSNRHAEDFERDAHFVTRHLWYSSLQIDALRQVLYEAGENEVTVEFKVEDGELSFIDWDTENYLAYLS